jgi:DNA repair protein RadC
MTHQTERHPALSPQARRTVARAIRCLDAIYNVRGPSIAGPQDARDYFKLRLYGLPHEVFACLLLDNRNRVIQYTEVFRGTIDGASVHPREIVRLVMEANAAAVIFAHNHPSGLAEPSQSDIRITQRLKDALALIDVRVLDHHVVGDGEGTSLAERGLL